MKYLKRNGCKGEPMICLQKGSVPIKAYLFLIAALFFSMVTVDITQTQAVPQSPATSIEEDKILNGYVFRDYDPNWFKEFKHYMRDGCKKALAGDWRRDTKGDVITITYDEEHKVFVGKVTNPVKLAYKIGHLLFKVYFPDDNEGILLPGNNENMDINWLRQQQQCRVGRFKGTEFSFDQKTKRKTEMNLVLILNADQLQYKLDKQAWNFTRLR